MTVPTPARPGRSRRCPAAAGRTVASTVAPWVTSGSSPASLTTPARPSRRPASASERGNPGRCPRAAASPPGRESLRPRAPGRRPGWRRWRRRRWSSPIGEAAGGDLGCLVGHPRPPSPSALALRLPYEGEKTSGTSRGAQDELAALAGRWGGPRPSSSGWPSAARPQRRARPAGPATGPGAVPRAPARRGGRRARATRTLVTERALSVLRAADGSWPRRRARMPSAGPRPSSGRPSPEVAVDRLDHRHRRRTRRNASDLPRSRPPPSARRRARRRRAVAFVTLGDPNVYSAFPALAPAVCRRTPGACRSRRCRG